jgi:hypothetical protein
LASTLWTTVTVAPASDKQIVQMTAAKVRTRRNKRQEACAKAQLEDMLCVRDWIRQAPRAEAEIRLYRRIRRELAAIAAGHRPTVATLSTRVSPRRPQP